MSFEKEVRIALIKKEWTLRDLADEMGITVPYLRDLLKGNRSTEARIVEIKQLLKEELKEAAQ